MMLLIIQFDDRIHALINDEKIINKRNRNAHSNYVDTEFVDTGALGLLFPLQELSKSVPIILTRDSLNDSPLLNESENSVMPKPNNSIKSPNGSKT